MDNRFNDNSGWYPHDGEGKGMCTGPGCDCDERNYGTHSSKGGISTLGAILCTIGGLIGACLIFVLLGIEEPPIVLCITLWVIISAILSIGAEKIGL